MHKKKALITGITGQDGSYLAEFLLSKGYEVHGLARRSSVDGHTARIEQVLPSLVLHSADLCDRESLRRVVRDVVPDEIYNLGAQSFVKASFEQPEFTRLVNYFGVLHVLDAVRDYAPKARFYQASTSEMFGAVKSTPQNEDTLFVPVSPYAESKRDAHLAVSQYRDHYGLFACAGILFNHESPRRGKEFVTRKIIDAAVRMKHGKQKLLELGNVRAQRDWGHARDYVRAMWMMLQQEKPADFVIGTGEMHSVREFVERAFQAVGILLQWKGTGLDEKGCDTKGTPLVVVNKAFFRPNEVHILKADASRAARELGWKPTTTFAGLIEEMVQAEEKNVLGTIKQSL